MSLSFQNGGSMTITNADAKYHAVNGASIKHRSTRLKGKQWFWGLVILIVAMILTATIVYYATSSNKYTSREPPDPSEPLPPSNSVLHAFKKGAVCTDGAPCSKIGRDILRRNGSAVDAAIAAMFCNGVFNSQSMGIGGGFIMTVYDRKNKKARSLISREVAPGKATKNMFTSKDTRSRTGALASGVPGELRGYWAAWKEYGRLPWEELVQPTVKFCRDGYFMTKHLSDSLMFRDKKLVEDDMNLREWFIHPSTGEFLTRGSLIRPRRLCDTLEIIAKEGGDTLNNGSLTKTFVEDVQEMGGIITVEDMAKNRPKWKEPLVASLHGEQTVYTSPPPGGGAILTFILNILDGYRMDTSSVANVDNSILTAHRTIEAMKFAFARRTLLADPEFVNITEQLHQTTSKEYAEEIRKKIEDDKSYILATHYGAVFYNQEDHGTAHLSVLAPDGDAVSVTSTVNLYFGAGVTSKRTGIILNSGMDDFSVPGLVNYFGVFPSPSNFIEPGKMALSSVTPTIITDKNGDVTMVIGASGGTKIISAVAGVIMKYTWFNNTIKEAVDSSRFHHQVYPMEVDYEYGMIKPVVEGLRKLGHKMNRYRHPGSIVCGLAQRNGTIYANADYRKAGEVYGVDL